MGRCVCHRGKAVATASVSGGQVVGSRGRGAGRIERCGLHRKRGAIKRLQHSIAALDTISREEYTSSFAADTIRLLTMKPLYFTKRISRLCFFSKMIVK